jgi:phosphoglycolate phosphatase
MTRRCRTGSHDLLGAAQGLPCIGAGWGPAEDGELGSAGAAAVVDTPRRC